MSWDTIRPFLRPRVLLPALLVAAGLAILLERLILTDAERIRKVLGKAEKFALEGRWDDAVNLLDPDYRFEGMTREDLREHARVAFRGRPLRQCKYFGDPKVEVGEGGSARALARVSLRGEPGTPLEGPFLADFEVGFRKKKGLGWVVVSIRFRG
jgi:hypothetical protein